MSDKPTPRVLLYGLLLCMLVASGWIISCGGGPRFFGIGTQVSGTVTTSLVDPPTCANSFDRVWVTVTKVTANTSASAAPNDSGWVTLVDLSSTPRQIDLLSLSSTSCVLTELGSATGLPIGSYQQIRLYLLANNATSGPSPNKCGTDQGFNCVVPIGGSPQELLLSSEITTGIKIPPGQIAGGSITLAAGQSADISITFNACASLALQGNGQYRLKPTLLAGEVSLSKNSISGTVIDSATTKPVPGALVLLEQPDSSGIDRVVDANTSASDGSFIFCPLPAGIYDVVVNAATANSNLTTTVYATTITFNVPLGTALTSIPLVSEGTSVTPVWSTFTGQVTTANAGTPTAADVTVSMLQPAIPTGGSPVLVTVPVFSSIGQPPLVTTAAASTSLPACPTSIDCFNYSLVVPSGNPQVGTFSSDPVSYTPPVSGTATYQVDGQTPDCTSSLPSPPITTPFVANPGGTTNVTMTLTFSGCTQPF